MQTEKSLENNQIVTWNKQYADVLEFYINL